MNKNPVGNICKYCNKGFKHEKTLLVHLCEPRRRHNQKNEKHVIIGFTAYLTFYEITQGNSKHKTYDDFAKSPYYSACVRFGQYLIDIRCINISLYTEFLIKKSCPIDKWCSDKIYESFLQEWILTEDHYSAAQRSLTAMINWADEQQTTFTQYFVQATTARIIHDILNGQVTAWTIYNSHSGQAWLAKLADQELAIIWSWINSERWKNIFMKYPDRQADIVNLMNEVGV